MAAVDPANCSLGSTADLATLQIAFEAWAAAASLLRKGMSLAIY